MPEETWLQIERRNKNKIIKRYQKDNTHMALQLSTFRSVLKKIEGVECGEDCVHRIIPAVTDWDCVHDLAHNVLTNEKKLK